MPRERPYIPYEVARHWEEDRAWVVSLAGQGRFDDIPDYAFRLLKYDEKHVSILHYISEGCTGTLLDSVPQSMLLTFFGLFRDRVDEIQDIEKARASKPGFYTLDLIGGKFEAVSAIFAMAEWWSDGLKTLPLLRQRSQFYALSALYHAAEMLQVPHAMFKIIKERRDEVIEEDIPTDEDLVAVYEDFPRNHEARQYTLNAWMDGYALKDNKDDNIDQWFEGEPELLQDLKEAIADFHAQQDSDGASVKTNEMTDDDQAEELTTGADAWMVQ